MQVPERDVLTPLAASVLFGKSGEAVRRAVKEKQVKSPIALMFGAKPIHLIDLDSARRYWLREPWPSYRRNLEQQLTEMRCNGMTIDYSGALTRYRVLHPYALIEWRLVDQLDEED